MELAAPPVAGLLSGGSSWHRPLGLALAMTVLAALVFSLTPLDLIVSRQFFAGDRVFVWQGNGFVERLRGIYVILCWLPLVAVIAAAVTHRLGVVPVDGRSLAYAILVYALVPGLLVNGYFKSHWGRARPRDVIEFGGPHLFTSPLVPGAQAGESFMSGEAAMAFACVAMAWAWRGEGRARIALALAAVFAVPVAIIRIGMGGHFLSDVVFAGLAVWIVAVAAYHAVGLGTAPRRT